MPAAANILVVDDEPSIRELLKEILLTHGYRVAVAATGLEALEKIRGGHFDLVILDMAMPGIGGMDVLRVLKSSPEHREIPVLVCTSTSLTKEVEAAFGAGADDYLIKPIDVKRIVEKVKSALNSPKTPPR